MLYFGSRDSATKTKGTKILRQWQYLALFLFVIWAIFPLWTILGFEQPPFIWKKYLSSHIPSSVVIAALGIFFIATIRGQKNNTKFIYSPNKLFLNFVDGFFMQVYLLQFI